MDLVFIYGPPAAGKLTVSRELARMTGFRLFDNHVSIDCARAVFDFGTPAFYSLLLQIRRISIAAAAERQTSMVCTFVYSHPEDAPYVDEYLVPFERAGGRACLVHLTCSAEALRQRVSLEGRLTAGKLATQESLDRLLDAQDLFSSVPGRESLSIDNTNRPPEEVATAIVRHYRLPLIET